jgi:hypothetical protein
MRGCVQAVSDNCDLLTRTNREKIEFTEMVKYHTGPAHHADTCECPEKPERKARFVNRPALLDQLKNYSREKDCNLSPQAERQAPRVKKAKLNPELNGFLTLDEITVDIYSSLDKVFEKGERDRRWLVEPIHTILQGLPNQTSYLVALGHHDLAHEVRRLTDKWVDMARRTLNHTVPDTMFANTVCGNCGGALVDVREPGQQPVVRCKGTPAEPPCGTEYPPSEWLKLYQGERR